MGIKKDFNLYGHVFTYACVSRIIQEKLYNGINVFVCIYKDNETRKDNPQNYVLEQEFFIPSFGLSLEQIYSELLKLPYFEGGESV